MSNFAKVSIRAEDIETLDNAVVALFRAYRNDEALKLAALAMKFRGESGFVAPDEFSKKVPEPSNVVSLPDYLAQCGRLA